MPNTITPNHFAVTICHMDSPEEFDTHHLFADELTQERISKLCAEVAKKHKMLIPSRFFAHVSFAVLPSL